MVVLFGSFKSVSFKQSLLQLWQKIPLLPIWNMILLLQLNLLKQRVCENLFFLYIHQNCFSKRKKNRGNKNRSNNPNLHLRDVFKFGSNKNNRNLFGRRDPSVGQCQRLMLRVNFKDLNWQVSSHQLCLFGNLNWQVRHQLCLFGKFLLPTN